MDPSAARPEAARGARSTRWLILPTTAAAAVAAVAAVAAAAEAVLAGERAPVLPNGEHSYGTLYCKWMLTNNATHDCEKRCDWTGSMWPQWCYMATTREGVANGNCSTHWVLDGGEDTVLGATLTSTLASCQRACIDSGDECAAYEYHINSNRCIFRNRLHVHRVIHPADEAAAGEHTCASPELACNALFDDECPTCFGRRVCMRWDESVYYGPRLCTRPKEANAAYAPAAALLTNQTRCLVPGLPLPSSSLILSRSRDVATDQCAKAALADPEAAPPAGCQAVKLAQTQNNAKWRTGVVPAEQPDFCVSTATLPLSSGLDSSHIMRSLTFPRCHDLCRQNATCLWFEWTETAADFNLASGTCRFVDAASYETCLQWPNCKGTVPSDKLGFTGPPFCAGIDLHANLEAATLVRSPSYDLDPLKKGEVRAASIAVCDRLVSKNPAAPAAAAACRKRCYEALRFDGDNCALAAGQKHEAAACVANVRGDDSAIIGVGPVYSLADCSDRCSQRRDCAAWEVHWRKGVQGGSQCLLKSFANVYAELNPANGGGGGSGVSCFGRSTSLVADPLSFRGARGCALDLFADPNLLCTVPLAPPVPAHLLAISAAAGVAGADCAAAVAGDAAALPDGCVVPAAEMSVGPRETAGSDDWRVVSAAFSPSGCMQTWSYGSLEAPAASKVSPGTCQDRCRAAGTECIYWMWELPAAAAAPAGVPAAAGAGGQEGDCHLRTEAEVRAALASGADCTVPEGGSRLAAAAGGCVFAHWRVVGAPQTCPGGERSVTDVEYLLAAAGVTTSTTTTTTPPPVPTTAEPTTVPTTEPTTVPTTESTVPPTAAATTASAEPPTTEETAPGDGPPSGGQGESADGGDDGGFASLSTPVLVGAAAGAGGLLAAGGLAYRLSRGSRGRAPDGVVFDDEEDGEDLPRDPETIASTY